MPRNSATFASKVIGFLCVNHRVISGDKKNTHLLCIDRVKHLVFFCSLDVIISKGYCVKSQWHYAIPHFSKQDVDKDNISRYDE